MIRHAGPILAALAILATGCSTSTNGTAALTSTRTPSASTTDAYPEPPAYTHTVDGKNVHVLTPSSSARDLLDTYNHVARTLRGELPDGGYFVQIDCATTEPGSASARLANGTIGVGRDGIAQVGNFGEYRGATGNTCP